MAIHVALNHVSVYRYDRWVGLSPQVVRLRPAPHCRTPILSYSLRITPEHHFVNWQQDPQGNYLARVVFPDKVRELRVAVDLVAELAVYNPFDFFLEPHAEQFPFVYSDEQARELFPYLRMEALSPRFTGYLGAVSRQSRPTLDFLVELNRRVQRDVAYVIRHEAGVQSKEETLALGRGSCRDSAWLLVQLLRHLGLAARFVSGYLIQLVPDVKALDGPAGPEKDFTDLHAWVEVYLPGAGWVGLDATSGLLAGEGHIPLACTPEPGAAAPITGAVDPSEVVFEHAMSVARVHESPRVTKPYTEAQWQTILGLGHAVDDDLKRMDVRLTMGGEPTFVSAEDRDGAEWNTTALGPTKRGLAAALLHRLRKHYGANGFVHFGQGKWYPGEQLPRWALGVFWRRDGEPTWSDPSLVADENAAGGHGSADAARFIRALAVSLGVAATHVQAGYEDVWYYLWRERRLPVNVDPFDARLEDEMERDRVRRVFSQGLDQIVGYALPLERDDTEGRWRTGAWRLREGRMYLFPGDSAMGYRLPLDSLPWASEADHPQVIHRDPSALFPPLPAYGALRARAEPIVVLPHSTDPAGPAPVVSAAALPEPAIPEPAIPSDNPPARFGSASGTIRTALCVEPRGGTL